MTLDNKKKFEAFLEALEKLKEAKKVLTLHRGMESDMAFELFNLDLKYNTIDQFAEKLFFFGNKGKSFWNNDVKRRRNEEIGLPYYHLNDLSRDVFDYIFTVLNSTLDSTSLKEKQLEFISKNEKTSTFFQKEENRASFLDTIDSISDKKKKEIKEHYLVILHQFGGSSHSSNSHYVSSSKNEKKANWYSKNGIVINFWDCDVKQSTTCLPSESLLPKFTGKPFKSDKEISLFACIFPHYIHSFSYDSQVYFNPAILGSTDFEKSILNGLKIDQSNFLERLKKETAYGHGVNRINYKDEYSYQEIGLN